MKKWVMGLLLLMMLPGAPVNGADQTGDRTRVELKTSMGVVVLELYSQRAPKTVANFLAYVDRRILPVFELLRMRSDAGTKGTFISKC